MRCNTHPDKARFSRYADADQASVHRGLRPYRCKDCGGWHLTSQRVTERTVEIRRTIRALSELRRKNITGPLRDAAEAKAKELGIV